MKVRLYITILTFFLVLSFLLLGCKGVGIFAQIATTGKIDIGSLQDGLSASTVFQISGDKEHAYFSSGGAFYKINIADRNENKRIDLPSGGWTNIQSITASSDNLLLALARPNDSSVDVGLFFYSSSNGFTQVLSLKDKNTHFFTGSQDAYKSIRVFCPNPNGAFYVNIMEYSGSFSSRAKFEKSSFHSLQNGNTDWLAGSTDIKTQLDFYISSGSYSDSLQIYRFSTINPQKPQKITGTVIDETGNQVGTVPDSGPLAAMTWLSEPTSAFIMSSSRNEDSSYPLFVSTDGMQWKEIESMYSFASFLDIRDTLSGSGLVLAGIRNVTNDSSEGGYIEIIASSNIEPDKWTLRTDRNEFTFAESGYIASPLRETSVVGLSIINGVVFASTENKGVWYIDAEKTGQEWKGQ